ncbi:MAG TPA: COR domain-containing protein [Puia sp.]|nr:COR domain-containing protein [Puia sp.]
MAKFPKEQGEQRAEQLIQEALESGTTFLDLGNLGLSAIPGSLIKLKDQLEQLVLGKRFFLETAAHKLSSNTLGTNNISDIKPLSILTRLKGLYLFQSNIGSLQPLRTLKNLETLDLKRAGVYDLDGIQDLGNLKNLDLGYNKLKSIDKLEGLANLMYLKLDHNALTGLDVFVGSRYPVLSVLNLSNNNFDVNDLKKIKHLPELKTFIIRGIGLRDIETLMEFTEVGKLDLSNNQIDDTSALSHFVSLRRLFLNGNLIRNLWSIQHLFELVELNIAENKIKDLEFIKELTNIVAFKAPKNQISNLSPIRNLTRLTFLDLSYNNIIDINTLEKLKNLNHVFLGNNEISDFTPVLQLQNIRDIDFSFNRITNIRPLKPLLVGNPSRFHIAFDLDAEVPITDGITLIKLFNNPIVDPPRQYLEAGAQAILSYWDQQDRLATSKRDKELVNEAKLIIVGNSHVGKSTLAYLLRNGCLPMEKIPSTHGMEFSTWHPGWKVDGGELTINIIDFGGQEYYHDVHHLFFNDRAIFLLLWNPSTNGNFKKSTPVGDRDQEKEIQHFNVEYWINAIDLYTGRSERQQLLRGYKKFYKSIKGRDYEENEVEDEKVIFLNRKAPVLLVQTFLDIHGISFLNMERLQKKYPRVMGAVSVGLNFSDTLEQRILLLTLQGLFENWLEHLGQSYNTSWIEIRDHIEQTEKGQYKIMTILQFKDYFLRYSGVDPLIAHSDEDMRTICITLNHWGAVLYRYETRELRDIVILNPQQFTRQVNQLLTERLRLRPTGIPRSEVSGILGIDQQKADDFLKVLKAFKMLFELPREDETEETWYISPMYLPEKPSYVNLFLSQFVAFYKIRYTGYFHKGILLECFDELGQELLHEQGLYFCWQWGLVLKRGDRIVCIEFDDEQLDQVLIKTIRRDGELIGRDTFIQDIFKAFDRINAKYDVDIDLSFDGGNFMSKRLLLAKMAIGLNKFDHEGKRFDVRDFSFLLSAKETGSPFKRVFVSYSSADRNSLDTLSSHLKLYENAAKITYWHDLLLKERTGWDEQIRTEMEDANILIMLLSHEYLGTGYIRDHEIPFALKALRAPIQKKQVFWILLRPCDYGAFPEIARYTIYSLKEKDALSDRAQQRAISEHENQDREWVKLLKMILDET